MRAIAISLRNLLAISPKRPAVYQCPGKHEHAGRGQGHRQAELTTPTNERRLSNAQVGANLPASIQNIWCGGWLRFPHERRPGASSRTRERRRIRTPEKKPPNPPYGEQGSRGALFRLACLSASPVTGEQGVGSVCTRLPDATPVLTLPSAQYA